MKRHALFILLTLSFLEVNASIPDDPVRKNIYLDYIQIQGRTNLNQFQLTLGEDFPVEIPDKINEVQVNINNECTIPLAVKDFEADNRLIYNDFLELLKAREYPYIYISIPEEQIRDLQLNRNPELFFVNVSLAGKTHNYLIRDYDKVGGQENYALRGNLKIRLTDFDLNPPEKGFGLIKVNDLIIIDFGLKYIPL